MKKKSLLVSVFLFFGILLNAQLGVTVNTIALQMAQVIAGSGVTVSNATLNCSAKGAGTFTYTGSHLNLTGGILLTTGNATTATQPYTTLSGDQVGNNGTDPDLVLIQNNAKKNLCKLDFDFVPICPTVNFKYVFGSEEYPTFVGSINDAFGVFLTGPNPAGGNYASQNIALLPSGQPVSINNVNAGSNAASFVPNYSAGYHYTDIVYDGFTTPITSTAAVTPCQSYHIKFAIADASDQLYDSGVFLQSGGLSCTNTPTIVPTVAAASSCGTNDGSASVSVSGLVPAGYSWLPGGETTASIINQIPGTYTCVMTFTTGCSTYTLAQVVVIGGNSSITPTSNTPCLGSSLILSTVSGATYSWTGPGGYTSAVQNPTITPASAADSGVYSVTVVAAGGCSSTGTVNISINPSPTVTMPATQTITCVSPSVSLTGSASPSTSTPVWTGAGICSGAGSYTAFACSAGDYTLTVTNPATGCSNSGTVSVVASSGIPSVTGSNSGMITCNTTTAEVVATTTSTPVTYLWTGPGAISGSGTPTGTVSAGGTYTCVVLNTSSGCSTTITTNVATNTTAPVPAVTLPATLTCSTPSITLSATPSSGVTYTWTGPGIVSGTNTGSPVVNAAGAYSLTVTDAANGCSGSANATVVNDTNIPALSLSSSSLTLTCANLTASVTASSTVTPLSYTWSPNPLSGTNSDSPTFDAQGNYTLTATAANGCTNTINLSVTTNTAIPSITVPANQTLTCASPSVNLIGSASPIAVNPAWTGSSVCGGATTFTASVCSIGIYTLTVTDPANGCVNSGTVTIDANTDIPSATATNSGSITCSTTTVEVAATSTSTPISYSWTGPGAITGAATSTGTVNIGGTYTCVVINTMSGCSTTITTNVPTNTTAPVPSITQPATLTCAAPSATLSSTPSSGVSYTWTGPGIISGTNTDSPVVNVAGVYSLSVTDAVNGCSGTTNVTVMNNNNIPVLSLSSSSLTLTCVNLTASVVATSTTTSLSYTWSPNPLSGVNTNAPTFNTPGSYTLTASNISGCSTMVVLSVGTDTAIPVINITPSQTLNCASPTAVINTTVNAVTPTNYSWTGAGITGPLTSSSVTVNQAGAYTVIVTNAVNGCTNTASSTISSAPGLPSVSITSNPANGLLTCTTQTVSLNAVVNPTTNISYVWSNGSAGANTSTSNAGVMTLTVLNTSSGCSVTVQYPVTSNTTAPGLNVSNNVIPCDAASITLSASSNTTVSYSWSGPTAGSILSGSNTANPVVGATGNYNVTIINTINGCSTTSVVSVSKAAVHAALSANPTTGTSPLNVDFSNQSTGATNYIWLFGDGNGSLATNPSNIYMNPGAYIATLVAISGSCTDTARVTIIVEAGLTIEIPNVFTPNGDHANDVFFVKSTGVKELSMIIFNRWGKKMCEASGADASWNGTAMGGAEAQDGTYFYIIKATGYDGNTIDKQGTVNLFR